jgi:hypothetical protein
MIPMSVQEIKEFWHGFCQRQGISEAVRAAGDQKIEADPEHWADQTMWELLDVLSGKKK